MGYGRESPAYRAAVDYGRAPGDFTFHEALEAHLVNGYVVSSPDVFILARPVDRTAPSELLTNPAYTFQDPDAWFIYLMAGDVFSCWHYYPIHYNWVGWQRRGNEIRFYPMEQIKRKAQHDKR